MLFCRIPFSWCSSHFQYKLFQLLGAACLGRVHFFLNYVWIKSGTVAFWTLEKTITLIIRKSSGSSLLCLALWTNVTPKWKCSHISLQIQDFSISSYAIDGKSQSILFSPEESVADKALCHSVTCFPDFSHSMMAALRLPRLFVSVWKSCPNLEEKGCSMQRETTDSNICENEAVFDSVHMHIFFFILISRVFLTY